MIIAKRQTLLTLLGLGLFLGSIPVHAQLRQYVSPSELAFWRRRPTEIHREYLLADSGRHPCTAVRSAKDLIDIVAHESEGAWEFRPLFHCRAPGREPTKSGATAARAAFATGPLPWPQRRLQIGDFVRVRSEGGTLAMRLIRPLPFPP